MPPHFLLGLVLSGGIGLSLGLIGGGGSIITTPVLVYVFGIEPHQAIGMSLLVVGATSLVGAVLHHRRGMVDLRAGILFGLAGLPGAWFGSRLTWLLDPGALLLIFAGLMIVVAVFLLAGRQLRPPEDGHSSRLRAALVGAAVGTLTGFLGVGGGFLIVPALVLLGGLEMKRAVGTSLLVISMSCAAGLFGHLHHGSFPLETALAVTAVAVAGALVGTRLSHRIEPASLRRAFALLVLAVAVFLIGKNV